MLAPKSHRYRILRDIVLITLVMVGLALLPRISRAELRVTAALGPGGVLVTASRAGVGVVVATPGSRVIRIAPRRTVLVSRPPVVVGRPAVPVRRVEARRLVPRQARPRHGRWVWEAGHWSRFHGCGGVWIPGHWRRVS